MKSGVKSRQISIHGMILMFPTKITPNGTVLQGHGDRVTRLLPMFHPVFTTSGIKTTTKHLIATQTHPQSIVFVLGMAHGTAHGLKRQCTFEANGRQLIAMCTGLHHTGSSGGRCTIVFGSLSKFFFVKTSIKMLQFWIKFMFQIPLTFVTPKGTVRQRQRDAMRMVFFVVQFHVFVD
tara:strand:+ start:156 stop:689 length:534 start_codon:yes stop_codon:yes gene_type:complete